MTQKLPAVGPDACVVGVDFGTLSGRAVVARVADGAELGSAVHEYEHGVIDETLPSTGAGLPPDWALQDPRDYVEVLRTAVPAALRAARVDPRNVVGIGTDFTACTVLPTLADGTPLCQVAEFVDRPHAYVKLWKHHAAQSHADRINDLASQRGEPWLRRYGGRISSEWEFAKGLQLLEEDPEVYRRTDRWVEAADWIVWQLTGTYVRNACATGYKACYQNGAYPSTDFCAALNIGFADFVTDKLAAPVRPVGGRAGGLTAEAAAWTGLNEGTAVCVGNVDAHVTAPAAGAVEPGQLVAMMGTSTCHVVSATDLVEVPGMCGVVRDGIVPGLFGYEAGQSGVGDIFGWFVEQGLPQAYEQEARARGLTAHELLSERAAAQHVGQHGLVALDWHNGNRSVLVDHELSGLVIGYSISTRPEDVYRALLEATAFGTRVIVDTLETAGVPVDEIIVAGGLVKNSLLMQIYSDVTRRPLSVVESPQPAAMGAAMHAAVAAGAYPDIRAAASGMGSRKVDAYTPDDERADRYDVLYREYLRLHDWFGRGGNDVMKVLHDLRQKERR